MRIKYKFCPQCTTKLTIKEEYPFCPKCNVHIYENSKPAAGALIIKDGKKVLLTRRGVVPCKGKYDAVGGFLKYNENPRKCVTREVVEETGLKVKIIDLLGIYTDTYGRGGDAVLVLYYVCKIVLGTPKPQDDVAELVWFSIDKIPKMAFPHQKKVIKDLKKWLKKYN